MPFLRALLVLLSLTGLLACSSQQLITETPTVAAADDQQATCKVAKDPLNPLIVEWPATAKADLESTSQRGLVVVSYAGCTLKVLSSCDATGVYDLTSVTPARDKLTIANDTELYARLPLGVASLKGELKSGSQLELDYVAVGQRVAAKPPVSLAGNCQGATHFVRTITVGAYSLDAHAKGSASAGVDVANTAGGGLGRKEDTRKIRGSGDVEKCAADPKSAECGAVLQLGLAPLQVGSGGSVTSAGFGQGLGPLGVVPDVVPISDTSGVGAASLKDVDVEYLSLLQNAKRAEKAPGPASDKARAWDELVKYPGQNPMRQVAEERRDEWERRAEAEARRLEQLEVLRERYTTDKSKLDKLVALDDDVVSKDQKSAYVKEFGQVYAPWKSALIEIGVVAPDAPKLVSSTAPTEADVAAELGVPAFVIGDWGIVELGGGYQYQKLNWVGFRPSETEPNEDRQLVNHGGFAELNVAGTDGNDAWGAYGLSLGVRGTFNSEIVTVNGTAGGRLVFAPAKPIEIRIRAAILLGGLISQTYEEIGGFMLGVRADAGVHFHLAEAFSIGAEGGVGGSIFDVDEELTQADIAGDVDPSTGSMLDASAGGTAGIHF
jgi:hypothetical protein